MKTILSTLCALALSATGVLAADLPVRTAPAHYAPVAPPLFAGFYAGLNFGGGWQRNQIDDIPPCGRPCTISFDANGNGMLAGAHAGANWQMGPWVFGLETDFDLTNIHHKTEVPLSEPDTVASRIVWEGSLRARMGYAIDRVLVYVTGGLAYANIKHTYDLYSASAPHTLVATESLSRGRPGWTLGGGVEYAFAPAWSARLEYRYSDFGSCFCSKFSNVFF